MQFEWKDDDNKVISCIEKNKILNENISELSQILQDTYEDAILMGVSKEHFRRNVEALFGDVILKST